MIDMPDLIGLDELGGGYLDAMEPRVERCFPKVQELSKNRKFRRDIEVLPNIGLEETWVIREMIEDFCRGEPIVLYHEFEVTHEAILLPVDPPKNRSLLGTFRGLADVRSQMLTREP